MTHTRSLLRTFAFASTAALAAACSEGAPSSSTRMLEGTLEVVVVEGENGGMRYFLLPDDRTADPVELRFQTSPHSSSGVRIAVDGSFEGDALHVNAFDTWDPALESSGQHVEALVTPERERTIAFVMVDYGQGVNVTAAEAQRFMFSTTNPGPTLGIGENDRSTLQFYDETSYGLFAVSGDVEGPLSWDGGAACNGSGGSDLARELRSQISTTYGHYIWYYGSRQSACEYGWGSLGRWNMPSSNVWFNGDLFDGAITHEIGHNLGYQHASSIDCGDVSLANDPMTCETTEYGSAVSIMGNTSNGHMMGIEKWYAGWFEGCNAVRVRTSGTFTLLPIENRCSGIQTLQIPMPVTDRTFDTRQSQGPSPARYYYLEYRNGTGLDTGMTPSVIVVASDDIASPNQYCARSVQLDMNPSTNPLNGMTAGQSFEDPAGGVSFSVTSLTPEAAVIEVELAATPMPNTCMDGTTLTGSGPATCDGSTGGMGGASGMGGAAGASGGSGMGAAGAGALSGMGGAGAGGAGAGTGGENAGSAGSATAGLGGVSGSGGTLSGSAGTPASGTGGIATAGGGGSPLAGAPGAGGAMTAGSGGGSGGAIPGSAGTVSTSGRPGTSPASTPPEEAGCGCKVAGSQGERSSPWWSSLAAVGWLALRRRRVR